MAYCRLYLRSFGTDLHTCANFSSLAFVPKHRPVCDDDIKRVSDFIHSSKNILVLTGAGISTESGIPDYRSEGVGLYARSLTRPILYQDFVKSETVRRRYWARNYVGWPVFSSFHPNATHKSLRDLELEYRRVACLVTQNVDSLHGKAGSKNVIELHGTAYRVICLGCDVQVGRHEFQELLAKMNPCMQHSSDGMRPDGDVELSQTEVDNFQVPSCSECGGILKPDIVFFGDNVPRERVERVKRLVEDCDALLVLGSSLSVFSGYRIILQAAELKRPIAIVNIGETRGDKLAHLKVEKKCGDVLPRVYAGKNFL